MTIHIDGFEEFAGEQNPATALQRASYTTGGQQWALVAGRISNSAALSGSKAVLKRTSEFKSPLFSVGFSHQFNGRGSVAWLKLGDVNLVLWLHPDTGIPHLNDYPGGALPTSNRWYYYEIEVERATGIARLYINNRHETQANELVVGALEEIEVALGYMPPGEYRKNVTPVPTDDSVKTFDDFYIRDGGRLGPIAVTTRFPTADKNVQWFAADPSKSHSASLSLHPPKPLDNYVASNVPGHEDRFTSAQPLANSNAVVATGIVVLARKSPQVSSKLGVFIGGQAGADLREGARTVESDWKTQYVFFDKNDADTVDGITAADFGIKVS